MLTTDVSLCFCVDQPSNSTFAADDEVGDERAQFGQGLRGQHHPVDIGPEPAAHGTHGVAHRVAVAQGGFARRNPLPRAGVDAFPREVEGCEPIETAQMPVPTQAVTGLPWLSPMCGSAPSPLAATLTREPALFRDLAAAHPEAGPALSVVWQDYATEPRLQLAFDPQRPDTPDRLLALAKAEASRGAPFDHVRWERFGDVLRALP